MDLNAFSRQTKAYLRPRETLRNSFAGGAAGCVASLLTCPLDVVKTRLQNQISTSDTAPKYRGTISSLVTIWRHEGYRGLYRGLGPTMLGYLPNWAIYFTCYDNLKTRIGHWFQLHGDAPDSNMKGDGGRDSSIVHILSAMGAGCVSTTLTNPFWVIKTRFMTQSNESAFRYHSIRHAIKTIYQTEGLRGFYKGLVPSLWGISHVAVQFPLYEKLKVYFRNRHSQGNLYNSSEMYDSQSTVPSSTSTTIMTTTHAVPNRPRAEPLATSDILLASCLSKMAASIATYPHEVIRTRLQNQTYTPSSLSPNSVTPPSSVSAQKFQPNTVNFTNIKQQQPSPTRPRYTSIIHCVKTIYRTESITAFYNGLSTNLLRTVPSSAVTLFTYEKLSRALKEWAEE